MQIAGVELMEIEYMDLIKQELLNRQEELKRRCIEDCHRRCGGTPEESMECLANLMTLEYLIDNA